MRRAKTKFRPSSGTSGSVQSSRGISKSGNEEKILKSPASSPVINDINRGVKGSPKSGDIRNIKSDSPIKPAAETNGIFIPPFLTDIDSSTTLNLIPIQHAPTTKEIAPYNLDTINGNIIDPPDNNDNDTTNIEEELFRFKKPRLDIDKDARVERPGKALQSELSVSTKSSRAMAIARRKQAEKNIEQHTFQDGQIDRTEISMSDLIHIGAGCGKHEMDFSKKLRERREAKERATTLSQLSKKTTETTTSSHQSVKESINESIVNKQRIPTIAKPKVRLDADGKVVIDKSSLYQAAVNDSPALVSDEIMEDFDDSFDSVNSLSFRKRKCAKRSKNWSEAETDRFREALTIVGNDFQAIASAFSRRSLAEIKRKYNRECKQNQHVVDRLLKLHESGDSMWDLSNLKMKDLEEYEEMERKEEEKRIKREKRSEARNKRNSAQRLNNNEKEVIFCPRTIDMDEIFGGSSEKSFGDKSKSTKSELRI